MTEALNSVSLSPGTGSVASTTATCTGKQKALSGGFSILPVPTGVSNNFAVIYRSLRSAAKTWSLSAFNAANATGWTVTVYAYCLVGKATTVRSASAGGGARFQNSAAVTPGCPSGLRLIGGGFAAPQPGATSAPPFLYPAESAAAGPGWRTTVFQLGESGGSFTSYGYCL